MEGDSVKSPCWAKDDRIIRIGMVKDWFDERLEFLQSRHPTAAG